MVHDFIVTQQYTAFPVLPLTGDIERAKPGLPAFAWEPEKGAFVGLMTRDASVDSVRWIEVDPVYVFHPANAYEHDGFIHCDMMEYPSAPLFPNPDGSRRAPVKARMVHWSINLADRCARVVRTPISDLVGEFPRIDERFTGLRYRHCWHAANAALSEALMFDSLAHIDMQTKRQKLRRFSEGDSVGEPVFVPRSAQAPEGDGWVLAVVHRARENRSDLLILDAQDIAADLQPCLNCPAAYQPGFTAAGCPADCFKHYLTHLQPLHLFPERHRSKLRSWNRTGNQ